MLYSVLCFFVGLTHISTVCVAFVQVSVCTQILSLPLVSRKQHLYSVRKLERACFWSRFHVWLLIAALPGRSTLSIRVTNRISMSLFFKTKNQQSSKHENRDRQHVWWICEIHRISPKITLNFYPIFGRKKPSLSSSIWIINRIAYVVLTVLFGEYWNRWRCGTFTALRSGCKPNVVNGVRIETGQVVGFGVGNASVERFEEVKSGNIINKYKW